MKFTDKNNNLTLFILLIGCICLVLFYKSNCLKQNNEGFANTFIDVKDNINTIHNNLQNIKNNIAEEKKKTEVLKNNINLLKQNKNNEVLLTLEGNPSQNFFIPADLNTTELVKYRNELKNSSDNMKTTSLVRKINQNKHQKVKQDLLDQLEELQKTNSELEIKEIQKNNDQIRSLKNPFYNINLKATKIKEPTPVNNQLKKDKFLIHLNNDCLSFDKSIDNQNETDIKNYSLKQCNIYDESQHMSIDYFKHVPVIEKNVCILEEEEYKNNENDQSNSNNENNTNNSKEKIQIQELDTSSYVKYFNQFISNEFDKLNETRKQYYGDEIAVVQPYIDDNPQKSKINCLNVDKEGISFQDCRLDRDQTWVPSTNDVNC